MEIQELSSIPRSLTHCSLLVTHYSLPQVPSFISSLSEVEQLAYADLLLKSNQSKYNETPIEV